MTAYTQYQPRSYGKARQGTNPYRKGLKSQRAVNLGLLVAELDLDLVSAALGVQIETLKALVDDSADWDSYMPHIREQLAEAGIPRNWFDRTDASLRPGNIVALKRLASNATNKAPTRRSNFKALVEHFNDKIQVLADALEVNVDSLYGIAAGTLVFDNERFGHLNPKLLKAGFPDEWVDIPNAKIKDEWLANLEEIATDGYEADLEYASQVLKSHQNVVTIMPMSSAETETQMNKKPEPKEYAYMTTEDTMLDATDTEANTAAPSAAMEENFVVNTEAPTAEPTAAPTSQYSADSEQDNPLPMGGGPTITYRSAPWAASRAGGYTPTEAPTAAPTQAEVEKQAIVHRIIPPAIPVDTGTAGPVQEAPPKFVPNKGAVEEVLSTSVNSIAIPLIAMRYRGVAEKEEAVARQTTAQATATSTSNSDVTMATEKPVRASRHRAGAATPEVSSIRAAALTKLLDGARRGAKAALWRGLLGKSLPYWATLKNGKVNFNDHLAMQVEKALELPENWLSEPVFPPETLAPWVMHAEVPLPTGFQFTSDATAQTEESSNLPEPYSVEFMESGSAETAKSAEPQLAVEVQLAVSAIDNASAGADVVPTQEPTTAPVAVPSTAAVVPTQEPTTAPVDVTSATVPAAQVAPVITEQPNEQVILAWTPCATPVPLSEPSAAVKALNQLLVAVNMAGRFTDADAYRMIAALAVKS